MASTFQDVLEFIRNNMTSAQRTVIVETLNYQARSKRAEAKQGLRSGMKVSFYSTRSYREVTGVIHKVNRVNVDVVEDGTGTKWRVSPGLLKPVVTSKAPATGDEF